MKSENPKSLGNKQEGNFDFSEHVCNYIKNLGVTDDELEIISYKLKGEKDLIEKFIRGVYSKGRETREIYKKILLKEEQIFEEHKEKILSGKLGPTRYFKLVKEKQYDIFFGNGKGIESTQDDSISNQINHVLDKQAKVLNTITSQKGNKF